MKFTKFGKALVMSALSVGIVLSVSSCVESYTVGYLYVTGTVTANSGSNGIISGFKIDHNTGKLTAIDGMPVSSGGANPSRAILFTGGHFIYVLNQGASADGNPCTTTDPCLNSNITQFAVGAKGILTAVSKFNTQGINPIRIIADGNYLYVLDHDSPAPGSTASNPIASSATNPNPACAAALGNDVSGNPISVCGDITAFSVNPTTGWLSLMVDDQASTTLGATLPYFPVPADPIDFANSASYFLTLNGTPDSGDSVFVYQVTVTNGQLTTVQNSLSPLNNSANGNGMVDNATAIVSVASQYVFVLDNEPITLNTISSPSQILPFTVGGGGVLTTPISGPIADIEANPYYVVTGAGSTGSKWFYVINQGNYSTTGTNTASSDIAGYVFNSPLQPTPLPESPYAVGSNPQCIVEDPSNQFFYEANANDSTVTGQALDQEAGDLKPLNQVTNVPSSYTLPGPATWCLATGKTD